MGVFKFTCFYARTVQDSCFYISKSNFVLFQEEIVFLEGHNSSDVLYTFRKGDRLFLAIFWIAGLMCGVWSWFVTGPYGFTWMRTAQGGCVSIVGLICIHLLPFLVSAFAVFVSIPELLFPLCFFRAFLFTVLSLGIMQSFPHAGWLVSALIQGYFTEPLLYFLWLRMVSLKKPSVPTAFWLIALVFSVPAGCVDHYIISPVLSEILYC